MNSYLFTLSFLLMMSLFTASEMHQFAHTSLETKVYQESRHLLAVKEELEELAHLEVLRGNTLTSDDDDDSETPTEEEVPKKPRYSQSKSKRAPSLKINEARPPNNSRINFYLLLHQEPDAKLPSEFSLYEVTARLMRNLYSEQSFFQAIPDVEYQILDKLLELREQTVDFCTPDELSDLIFEDEALQAVFYRLLKGTKEVPSFLHFITFDQGEYPLKGERQKLNIMFADPALLRALFPDEITPQRILDLREALWEAIEYQEKHRTPKDQGGKGRREFKEDLKKPLKGILLDGGYDSQKYFSKVLDTTLGEMGSIIFIEDPSTGELVRQKYKTGAHVKHKAPH